jgi:hypothetical protein
VLAARLSEDPCAARAPGRSRTRRGGEPQLVARRRRSRPRRQWEGLQATLATGSAREAYLRGRGVGGSSAINAMLALPGDLTTTTSGSATSVRRVGWRSVRSCSHGRRSCYPRGPQRVV